MTTKASDDVLARVADLLATRLPANGGDPASSYVAKLFSMGPDAALENSLAIPLAPMSPNCFPRDRMRP